MYIENTKRCVGTAKDGTTLWYYGLELEERIKAQRCRRRKEHRGRCSVFSCRATVINGKVVLYSA